MMGGSALPYDAEVEYLESTGAQYIDADVLLHSTTAYNYSFEFKCYAPTQTDMSTIFNCMFENKSMNWPGETIRYEKPSGNRINYSNNTGNINSAWNGPFYLNTTFVAKGGNRGTDKAHNTPTTIFASWKNGAPYRLSILKLYYFKLINNDVLVRDFVPVRKNGVGYLYDRVSGQLFGNAGTGQFIVGQDKKE